MDLDDALRELARLSSLHQLIQWGLAQDPPRVVSAVIVQDEFTHDVVVPWGDGRYLVFDTT